MGDQKDQDNGVVETRDSSKEISALTRRLLQRSTGKAGVLDLRHAQQLYARTAGWVEARFPLMRQLSPGLAPEGRAHSSSIELVMGRPLMEQVNAFADAGRHLQSGPPSQPTEAASARSEVAPIVSPSSLPRLRVSRRPPQMALKVDRPASHAMTTSTAPIKSANEAQVVDMKKSADHAMVAPTTSHSAGTPRPIQPTNLKETEASPQQPISAAPASLILAKRTAGGARETSRKQAAVDFSNRGAAPTSTRAAETPATPTRGDSPPVTADPKPRAASSEISAAPQTVTRLLLRSASMDNAGPESGASPRVAKEAMPVSDSATRHPEISQSFPAPALPLALPQAAALIQRKADNDGSIAKPPQETPGEVSREPVVVKEIKYPPPSRPSPNIIWRKSESGSMHARPDQVASSGPPAIARQTTASAANAATSEVARTVSPSPAPEQAQSVENNLEDSTEQIIRVLYRRLEIERERRGIE